MKCPVCDNVNIVMVCPKCGFDSSRDFGKYPTFGPVGRVPSASALRKQRQEKPEEPPKTVEPTPVKPEPPAPAEKKRKLLPLLIAATFAVVLGLGVWISAGMSGGSSAQAPGDGESAQVSNWRANVLKANTARSNVYGTGIKRSEINTVTFLDSLENAPNDAFDVSMNADGSVLMWSIKRANSLDLFFAADGGINGREACYNMFNGYNALTHIDFGGNFHTDEVKDMSYMFRNCRALVIVDLSTFDTSNLRYTVSMFENCPAGDVWQHLLN